MTLKEARTDLVAQDSYDPALYKGTSIDAEGNTVEDATGLNSLLNDAILWWAKLTYCCYDPSVALTLVIGTDKYSCRNLSIVGKKILKPRVVVINDVPLLRRDGKQYGLWTMDQLQRDRPQFRLLDDAQPDIAVWLPTNELLLSAPPVALYTGKNFIDGWTLPDPLGDGDEDEELPIPEEDHSALVRLALDYGTLPQMEDARAGKMFRNESWWREQAQRRQSENITKHLGRIPRGDRACEWL